jgi:RNA polymerase sigma-70 factor (ECF subfamily)
MGRADDVLADLVARRWRDLVAYAALCTGDLAAAEDLVHDALVKVFGRMRAGFEPDVAEAYVRTAIVSLYVDSFRRRRLWRERAHLVAPTGDEGADTPGGAAAALDLRAALATLGPQERACVVLRYYADRTVPEIAAELHLAEGTVKRYLSNALHRLHERLGALDEEPAPSGPPTGDARHPRRRSALAEPDHVDVLPERRA